LSFGSIFLRKWGAGSGLMVEKEEVVHLREIMPMQR